MDLRKQRQNTTPNQGEILQIPFTKAVKRLSDFRKITMKAVNDVI
jgi:hypothetical protein